MSSPETDVEEPDAPKAGLGTTAWSVWSWFVFGSCVIVWTPLMAVVWLVTWPFDRARWWTGYLFRKLAVLHQMLNPLWHFKVSGTMPENPRNPYVVVSNHESFVDILLISHLPWEMKWLSKIEIFKLPLVGWLMRMAKDIPLERGDRESAGNAMEMCKVALERNVSVMIFPEGTRSVTTEMREFKDGAFRLAVETQLPILPLAVSGTRDALRKHDWRFGRADAEVYVMSPVPTEGLTGDDVPELKEKVRAMIESQRDAMRVANGSASS